METSKYRLLYLGIRYFKLASISLGHLKPLYSNFIPYFLSFIDVFENKNQPLSDMLVSVTYEAFEISFIILRHKVF